MTTQTELIVDRVLPRWTTERQALALEIEGDMKKLEALREKEAVLRAVLVNELMHLEFKVQRARLKIYTQQWADGSAQLDTDWQQMKTAEEALMECVEEIAHAAGNIEDQQATLDDLGLWREEQ